MAVLYSQISIAFNFKFAFEIGDYEMEKWKRERNYKRIRDKMETLLQISLLCLVETSPFRIRFLMYIQGWTGVRATY